MVSSPFGMEGVAFDVERRHFGVADLDAFFVCVGVVSQRTVRPFLVVVAAINSTTADRLVSGRPRQFCVMWQNRRCSILFHFDVPGG